VHFVHGLPPEALLIEVLERQPDNVLAIRGSGQVTARDYETIVAPAVAAILDRHPRFRLLYELGGSVSGFTPGAAWEDLRLGLHHVGKLEKAALVSDEGWIRAAAHVFGPFLPCPFRLFENAQKAEAESWIARD
jgi:hypothetical protein